ncbi:MAG TPA: sugar transferase [Sumerlaeia bacterium]|nr:sugar transferase [Sumerlaeia bacterium]
MLVEALKLGFRSGYLRTSLLLNRIFNVTLSLLLIVLCAPLFILIGLAVLIRDGRPALYKSTRLGLHKKPFTMHKFRTLVPDADRILGAQLVCPTHRLMTPLGRLLRDTRMDELPQLFNILMGDMDFLGPRPERPEVYEKICRYIQGYDKRFSVNPGLLGFSQIFTPHSTPKRIRVFIDNRLVRKKQIILWDVFEVFATGLVVLRTAAYRLSKALYQDLLLRRILRRYREKRELDRPSQRSAMVFFRPAKGTAEYREEAELVDVNERAFLMRSDHAIDFPAAAAKSQETDGAYEPFVLRISLSNGRGIRRRKTARCRGRLYRAAKPEGNRHEYVIMYEPSTPLNFYMMHQYFLRKSMALSRR